MHKTVASVSLPKPTHKLLTVLLTLRNKGPIIGIVPARLPLAELIAVVLIPDSYLLRRTFSFQINFPHFPLYMACIEAAFEKNALYAPVDLTRRPNDADRTRYANRLLSPRK
ncbi:hypothetical protein Trydic_g10861 [Trypoxylus dichotomus]